MEVDYNLKPYTIAKLNLSATLFKLFTDVDDDNKQEIIRLTENANRQYKDLLRVTHNKPKYCAYRRQIDFITQTANKIVKGRALSDVRRSRFLVTIWRLSRALSL